jgi:hypothetical protein
MTMIAAIKPATCSPRDGIAGVVHERQQARGGDRRGGESEHATPASPARPVGESD